MDCSSGHLDHKEVHRAIQSMGCKISLQQVHEVLLEVNGGKESQVDMEGFERMLHAFESDEKRPALQDMMQKIREDVCVRREGQDRVHELQRMRQNKPRQAQLLPQVKSDAPVQMIDRVRPMWMPSAVEACRTRDARGRLPLHAMCQNEGVSVPLLKILLHMHPGSCIARDGDGCLALHLLCSNPAVTELLIATLVDAAKAVAPDVLNAWTVLDVQDMWGQLPLHRLCANVWVYPQLLAPMIKAHLAAVCAPDNRGWTPLQHLLRNPSWAGGMGAGAKKVSKDCLDLCTDLCVPHQVHCDHETSACLLACLQLFMLLHGRWAAKWSKRCSITAPTLMEVTELPKTL